MSHFIYKRLTDDDGHDCDDPTWHIMSRDSSSDTSRFCCTGEAYDPDSGLLLEKKWVKRGGITCNACLTTIKSYKQIKL